MTYWDKNVILILNILIGDVSLSLSKVNNELI